MSETPPQESTDDIGATPQEEAGTADVPEWLTLDEGERIEWTGEPELASAASEFITGIVLLPLLGLGLLVIVPTYLRIKNIDYVVTNHALYTKRGIVSTSITSVELDKIQNTEYSQSFVEKLLGYGTVGVDTAGGSGVELAFEAIADAREVQELVRELAKQYREVAPGGEAEASEDPIAELADELARTREALENVQTAVSRAMEARSEGAGEHPEDTGAHREGAEDHEPDAETGGERSGTAGDEENEAGTDGTPDRD